MKISLDTIGIFVLFLLQLIQDSLACSCQELHPQSLYCKSHFVIKAKVKSEEQLYGMRRQNRDIAGRQLMFPTYKRYKIRLSKIFKDSPEYQNVTKHYIYTSSMDSTCGVKLKNDTKYLLQGRIVGDKPLVSTCDSPVEWHHVSVRQRKGYNYQYEQNCGCLIEFCGTPHCEKKTLPNGCFWNQAEDPGQCYSQHSMCVDRGNNSCHWARTTLMKKCLETVKEDGRVHQVEQRPHYPIFDHEVRIEPQHNHEQETAFTYNGPHHNIEP